MNQNKYYKTNAFYLAAFLSASGIALDSIEKTNFNKTIFVFKNTRETQDLVRVFNFGKEDDTKLLVNFKKVEAEIKHLKSLIYD
ncbi:MAG: DUF5659 domain-containing protein [Parcubacteria group bacterium]|jgi:hypothetical protein